MNAHTFLRIQISSFSYLKKYSGFSFEHSGHPGPDTTESKLSPNPKHLNSTLPEPNSGSS